MKMVVGVGEKKGYRGAKLVFKGTPGTRISGRWSPDSIPQSNCQQTTKDANTKNVEFELVPNNYGICYTTKEEKLNKYSVYLNLISEKYKGQNFKFKVQVLGVAKLDASNKNCTWKQEYY